MNNNNELYYIAAFRSRSQTIRYYELLKEIGLNVTIMNTPMQASVGCGISVRILPCQFKKAKELFVLADYNSFVSFFCVEVIHHRMFVERV